MLLRTAAETGGLPSCYGCCPHAASMNQAWFAAPPGIDGSIPRNGGYLQCRFGAGAAQIYAISTRRSGLAGALQMLRSVVVPSPVNGHPDQTLRGGNSR